MGSQRIYIDVWLRESLVVGEEIFDLYAPPGKHCQWWWWDTIDSVKDSISSPILQTRFEWVKW
jgi:hypothetical protein